MSDSFAVIDFVSFTPEGRGVISLCCHLLTPVAIRASLVVIYCLKKFETKTRYAQNNK